MKFKISLLSLLFFCATMLYAQTDFRQGYVIKTANDTVWGEIDYRGDKMMGEICTFRKDKNAEVTTFAPTDILGFRFIDSKYFISKEVNGKKVFLEFLINGKVNIYYLRDEAGDHYYIDKEGEKLIEIPYEEEIRYRKDDTPYNYQSKKHIGVLTYYLREAIDLIPEINQMKQPEHKQLVRLAEKYHNEVCDGTKCIIYEKKMPFKIDIEPVVGFVSINSNFGNENGIPFTPTVFVGGVLTHIWLPRKNENLYLKLGLVYLWDKNNGSKAKIYSIPLHLEYLYPRGIFRPRVSIGFNSLIFFPACSAGADVELSKLLSLTMNYNISFYSEKNGMNLPDRIYSNGLYAGLRFKL